MFRTVLMMKKRTTAIAAALSLLVCGSPLLTGCSGFRENIAFQDAQKKLFNLKDYSGAISDYSKVIKFNPSNSSAYNNRGYAKYNLGDNSGAILDFNKAIEINQTYTDAYYSRGIAKGNLEDYLGAISDYNKAIELIPNFADYYFYSGDAKDELRDYSGEISDLEDAYNNRVIAKALSRDMKGFCSDWTKASGPGDKDVARWVKEYCQ